MRRLPSRPWKADMVLNGAGNYIPAESIGVRIEDDVLITKVAIKFSRLACPGYYLADKVIVLKKNPIS